MTAKRALLTLLAMGAPPGRPRATFRPRFTLMLLYLFGFFMLFALLFALPDLLAGVQELPPGGDELTPEELDRAREIARGALRGRVPLALGAAVVATGLGIWTRALPGLRD